MAPDAALKELKKLRVVDLKALLKERGLDEGGLKDDLVRRLHDAQTADAGADAAGAADPPEEDAPAETAAPAETDAPAETAAAETDAPADARAGEPAEEAQPAAIPPAEAEADPAADETDDAADAAAAPADPPPDSRLSNASIDRARARLAANAHDLDAWQTLATEAAAAGAPGGRSLFEEVLERHPTSSETWRAYAESEIEGDSRTGERDDDAVKSVFSRCLLLCPSAKLWRAYTRYMVAANDPTDAAGVAAIKAAFEYTVDAVGEDIDAGPLWVDYLTFLRAVDAAHVCPDVFERNGDCESARTVEVRKAFRRAATSPTDAVDVLYREYDAFETGLDPTLAKALLAEIKPFVDRTRSVLKERKKRTKELVTGGLTFPFAPEDDEKTSIMPEKEKELLSRHTRAGETQSRLWRAYARWERSNPQALEPDVATGETEHPQVTARVQLAYDQALMSLRHFPEVWLEYAAWHSLKKRFEDASLTLARGREANPFCAALLYAHADSLERRGVEFATQTKAVYEEVLDTYERECAEKETAFVAKEETRFGETKNDGPNASLTTEAKEAKEAPSYAHARASDFITSAYVEYMRCCRRVEGAAAARKAFMRARKAPGLGDRHEVYACSAQLEWRYDKNDKPARNVFELGLKRFIGDPAYVALYAEFLVGVNDVANARVLYERATGAAVEAASGNGTNTVVGVAALAVNPAERARRLRVAETLFDAFAAFEHHHGSLDAMASVEARRHAALGEEGGGLDSAPAMLTALMRRHAFLTLTPATHAQARHYRRLGASFGGAAEQRSAAPSAPPPVPPPIPPPRPPPLRKGEVPPGAAAPGAATGAAAPQLPKAPRPGNIPKLMPPPPPPGSAAAAAAAAAASLPSELGAFVSRLPAAGAFGEAPPHVVDAVMDALLTSDLSPEGGAAAVAARNDAAGVGDAARGAKRKAAADSGASSGRAGPLTAASNKPPAMDVFRMRQAKQARTDNAEFQ
jgi:cleavage stimulation factor subunit 3